MKKTLSIFIFILPFLLSSQNMETIDWITNNSIKIEDSNPDSELKIFKENTPAKFVNAKIYGFGEASHNTKEFFDLKAKFFKYLVKTQGVRSFIMEESYQAESGINEWISGGKGDITTIAKNFNTGFWYTKEIVNLLQWIRNYNLNKAKEKSPEWINNINPIVNDEISITKAIRKYIKDNPEADEDLIEDRIENLKKIKSKQVGIIELDASLDIDTVTEIFIRINQKGVVLSNADFVMSKIASDEQHGGNKMRKMVDYFCRLLVDKSFHKHIVDNDTNFTESNYYKSIK